MTNLFTRLKETITADLHAALDHKEKTESDYPSQSIPTSVRARNRKG